MTPIMEELAREFEGAFTLAKIYWDGNPKSRDIQSEASIPNLVFYKNGEKKSEIYGIPSIDSFSHILFAEDQMFFDEDGDYEVTLTKGSQPGITIHR